MTARFINSAPIERAFQTRKQWQTAGRREHVHGRVQPMHEQPSNFWAIVRFAVMVVCTGYALSLWIVR
jgi:hypothetical protein